MSAPAPYRLKDALLGLFVGTWLTALPGYGLYALAPETVHCTRDGAGTAACRLRRTVAGIPLRSQSLGVVRGATLEQTYSAPRFVQGRRSDGGSTYVVRYDTAAGPVDGASGPVRDDHEAIVTGLNEYLRTAGTATFDAAIAGGPLLWRAALSALFALGALCLINIPFASAAAMRARAAAR